MAMHILVSMSYILKTVTIPCYTDGSCSACYHLLSHTHYRYTPHACMRAYTRT